MNELVWVDCEMTGLDLDRDALIEVACVVTDADLNVLGEGVDVVIRPSAEQIAQMSDFVKEMHTSSGLLDELGNGVSLPEANQIILDHIKQFVPAPRRAPLAGNTIGTDRAFLARDLPEVEAWMHYRNVDVSTIKELSKRWFPKAFYNVPAKGGNHRALADILESIEELRYYREAVFVPIPGPGAQDAKSIAVRHQGILTGFAESEK